VADADGTSPVQITNLDKCEALNVYWSADGNSLFIGARRQRDGLLTVRHNLTSRSETTLLTDGFAAGVSRDGHWLYYHQRSGGQLQLGKLSLQNGERRPLTHNGGRVARETRDGQYVIYAKSSVEAGVWRMPTDGTDDQSVQLIPRIHLANLFAVASDGIYFVSSAEINFPPSLRFFRFSDSRTSTLMTFPKNVFWGLDLSPDERWLLCSQHDLAGSDIMLIDPLR